MARYVKSKSSYKTSISYDNKTGEKVVSYDRSARNQRYNGGFVYSIFIILCCFLVFLGVYGVATHDNPMDMVIQSAKIVSDYGENAVDDIKSFSGSIDHLKIQIKSDEDGEVHDYDMTDAVFWNAWFYKLIQKLSGKNDVVNFLVNVYNQFVGIVNFLTIIPYAIGRFAVGILVVLFRIIYVFII